MDSPDAWNTGNDGGWRPDAFIGDTVRDGGFPPGSRTDAGPVDEDGGAEPADGGG